MLLYSLIAPVFSQTGQTKTFNTVWEIVNDNFFDPKFNGVDWKNIRSKYAPQLKQTQSTTEMAEVINQMLSELKTSHIRFYTPLEPAYYQILGIFAPRNSELRQQLQKIFPQGKIEYSDIGIVTKEINGNTFIKAIFDGSPAAKSGLMVGDRVLSIDAQPFQAVNSFKGKANQKVNLRIQRQSNASSQQEIAVTSKLLDATTMFLDAMEASIQIIEQQGKKIGYVHIWSYAGDQYQEQLEEELFYGRLRGIDALVLDLREGWGGAPLKALNIYTAKGPSVTSIRRDGRRYIDVAQWRKPVVLLVNEGSRSAKEILAYGFQQYNIGTVVGTKTAGAVVAGTAFLLPDGNMLYLAVADVYIDGNKRLEGVGVTPDEIVPFSLEYAQGKDPQKERAIEIALEKSKN